MTYSAKPFNVEEYNFAGTIGVVIIRVVDETAELSETRQRVRLILVLSPETVQIGEATQRLRNLIRDDADTVTIAETVEFVRAFFAVVTETEQLSEATQRLRLLDRETAETVTVTEATQRLRKLTRETTETVQIAEDIQRLLRALQRILIQGRQDILLRVQGRRDVLVRIQGKNDTDIRIQGRQAMAVAENVSFYRGEDVTLEVEVTTTGISGGPDVDITGWALVFNLKKRLTGKVVLTKSIGSGITITDGTAGRADVTLTDEDTLILVPGEYVFDVKRDDAGAEAILTVGTLTVKETVSP